MTDAPDDIGIIDGFLWERTGARTTLTTVTTPQETLNPEKPTTEEPNHER